MKLTKEQKDVLKQHYEVLTEAKALETEHYEKYNEQVKRVEELKKELVKVLVEFNISDLYQVTYNYLDKLGEIVK